MKSILKEDIERVIETVPVSFHVPGHKYGRLQGGGGIWAWDTTEIPGTDNLHEPTGIIKDAMNRIQGYYGSRGSYLLVNGTTGGLLASILTVVNPGDKLLIGRDCHQSVYHGAWLAQGELSFVEPIYRKEDMLNLGITPESVLKALEGDPSIKAVVVTSPTYYGICSDIAGISAVCKQFGALLLVDEAHGAHFKASSMLPKTALEQGADLVVQSAHKTLPVLTQGSLLHVGSTQIDISKLEWMLKLVQTSSPSYVLMASIDEGVRWLQEEGTARLETLITQIAEMGKRLENRGIFLEGEEQPRGSSGVKYDRTRLVLRGRDFGISGSALAELLRERFGVQMEMSTPWHAVGVCSMATSLDDLKALEDGLLSIKAEAYSETALKAPDISKLPEQVYSWRSTQENPREWISLKDASGKISWGMVVPYPPGAPVLIPGERIGKAQIDYIQACLEEGLSVMGLDSEKRIQVVTQ